MKWHTPRLRATCLLILTSRLFRAGSQVRLPAFLPTPECVPGAETLNVQNSHSPSIELHAVPCEALCDSGPRERAGQLHTATATPAVLADKCEAPRESAARSPAEDRQHASG